MCAKLQDRETSSPYTHKKSHRMRRSKIDESLAERCTDPDSRVPVVNNDGQILTGDEAPLLRELDIWLEEHPTFTPLCEVSLANCHRLSSEWNNIASFIVAVVLQPSVDSRSNALLVGGGVA